MPRARPRVDAAELQSVLPARLRNIPTTDIRVHADTKAYLDSLRRDDESFDAFMWRLIIIPARTEGAHGSSHTPRRRAATDAPGALQGHSAPAGMGAEE